MSTTTHLDDLHYSPHALPYSAWTHANKGAVNDGTSTTTHLDDLLHHAPHGVQLLLRGGLPAAGQEPPGRSRREVVRRRAQLVPEGEHSTGRTAEGWGANRPATVERRSHPGRCSGATTTNQTGATHDPASEKTRKTLVGCRADTDQYADTTVHTQSNVNSLNRLTVPFRPGGRFWFLSFSCFFFFLRTSSMVSRYARGRITADYNRVLPSICGEVYY